MNQLEAARNKIDAHFVFVYPEDVEGEMNTTDAVLDKIKQLHRLHGLDGFLIDPFNQLTATAKAGERTDQYLQRILSKIDRLCKTCNLSGNIVAHPNKLYKKPDEKDYTPHLITIFPAALCGPIKHIL